MASRKILVTGATGQQGGAAIQALLASPPPFDYQILALTRNTSSAKAQTLASNPKVELISGDLNDCPAIFAKAGGHDSIQGCSLIDAAIANGVKHFVYTSVDRGGTSKSDTNPTKIGHFISKHNVEQYLREKSSVTGMTWTILRPVAFMENMTPGFFCKMFAAMWLGMGESKRLQLVATRDIGIFATKAFAGFDTDQFRNRAISLAGDELTQPEANEVFWRVFGRPMPRTYVWVGSILQSMIKEIGVMFTWFKEEGYGADIQQCRNINPEMLDVEAWLRQESGHRR